MGLAGWVLTEGKCGLGGLSRGQARSLPKPAEGDKEPSASAIHAVPQPLSDDHPTGGLSRQMR